MAFEEAAVLAASMVQDRLGIKHDIEKKIIMPETPFQSAEGDDTLGAVYATDYQFIVGEKYTVTIDGVPYVTECVFAEVAPDVSFNMIGNTYFAGGEDNGLPFYGVAQNGQIFIVILPEDITPSTVSVTQKTETIHPIDPKYLPGVCLPVVELTTVLSTTEKVTLTANEVQAIESAVLTGCPVCVTFTVNGGIATGAFSVMNAGTGYTLYANAGIASVKIDGFIGGNWVATATMLV